MDIDHEEEIFIDTSFSTTIKLLLQFIAVAKQATLLYILFAIQQFTRSVYGEAMNCNVFISVFAILIAIRTLRLCVKSFIFLIYHCQYIKASNAQTWIWYPGDYEIWLSNQMQNRRTDRGTFFPVFWKVDNHYVLMDFHKTFDLKEPEEVSIYAEGQYNVKLDGKPFEGTPTKITVPAGKHKINIKVFCQQAVPSVYVKGKTIISDGTWLTTFEDKEWIDETGKTSDISATKWLNAGYWNFNDPLQPPSQFKLPVTPLQAVNREVSNNSMLVDFGKETFGFIKLHGLKGKGNLTIYYGESKEEALSKDGAVTLDRLTIDNAVAKDSVMPLSKAFRYINIVREGACSF